MSRTDIIRIHVWTEHFLGTRAKGRTLLDLLESMDGGQWIPDYWGHFEPVKTPYSPTSIDAILDALTEERGGRISNASQKDTLLFDSRIPRRSVATRRTKAR